MFVLLRFCRIWTESNSYLIIRGMEAMQYNRDNLADKLRAHGINPTHQRIEIAHALFSRCEHLSADQVMAIVNERHSETSKATVYNTLNLFLEKKLIREVIVDPNKVFYDPNTSPHYHMYDIESGKLTDIDAADVRVSGLPALPAGMVTVVYEPQYALNPAKTDYVSVLSPGTPKSTLPHPMPIAITFFAGQGGEPTLIRIGTAYEVTTHHRTPPPAFGPLSGAPGEAAPRRTSVASPNAVAARR